VALHLVVREEAPVARVSERLHRVLE
jgi:hypothetical protein